MRIYNYPNIIPAGTVLNTTLHSKAMPVQYYLLYNIQAVWAGTPTGSFYLEASSDPCNDGIPGQPVNWTTIANSTEAISAAGNFMWNVYYIGYNWVRLSYSDGSSGASTATVTVSTFNGKGY